MISRRVPLISALALVVIIAIVVVRARSAPAVAPKGYAIAEISVTDAEAYKLYVVAVSPIVAHYEGKYLVPAGTIARSKVKLQRVAS